MSETTKAVKDSFFNRPLRTEQAFNTRADVKVVRDSYQKDISEGSSGPRDVGRREDDQSESDGRAPITTNVITYEQLKTAYGGSQGDEEQPEGVGRTKTSPWMRLASKEQNEEVETLHRRTTLTFKQQQGPYFDILDDSPRDFLKKIAVEAAFATADSTP